jgi:glyoxylase-like metal-dependent hydrolase (beta-lactamase superfamily II)
VFFSGDHVLPRISPNISAFVSGLANPLAAFLDSLSAVAGYTSAEVLPAHEYCFRGLADRGEDLRRHHDARLAEVLDVVRAEPGLTTFTTAARLTWSRDWSENRGFVRRSAIGETLAHLVLLEHRGVLSRVSTMPDRWLANPAAGIGDTRLAVTAAAPTMTGLAVDES